jgi:hypothetical protein
LVQLRLHHKYPVLGLIEVGPRSASVHRRPPRSALMLRTRWTPSPCDRLSRPRTTTGPPSHPRGVSRRLAFPPTSWLLAGEGTAGSRGRAGAPCRLSIGGFPRPALRTGRATLTASGSPRTHRSPQASRPER